MGSVATSLAVRKFGDPYNSDFSQGLEGTREGLCPAVGLQIGTKECYLNYDIRILGRYSKLFAKNVFSAEQLYVL